MNKFKVTVDTKADKLAAELGMSAERIDLIVNHLAKTVSKAMLDDDTTVGKVIETASEVAETANELAFIGFSIGCHFESQRKKSPMDDLIRMLRSAHAAHQSEKSKETN